MTDRAYDAIGVGYAARRPDARIGAQVAAGLGDARRVLNVGAGTGSYEPGDRWVVAVEPAAAMVSQRPAGSAPCVRAVAEALPLAGRSFDAAMAILTLHHWPDPMAGLEELDRVADRVVVLTFEPAVHNQFWLFRDYLPGVARLPSAAGTTVPAVADVAAAIGADRVERVLIPHDCVDGFGWAYWRRPHRYLEPEVAAGISALRLLPAGELAAGLDRLADDLATGRWQERYGGLLDLDAVDGGFRLVVRDHR